MQSCKQLSWAFHRRVTSQPPRADPYVPVCPANPSLCPAVSQVNDKFSRDFREVVAMMDLRSRNAMKKARAKQQAEEKARKEAESRAARMAALQALADDTLAAVEPLKVSALPSARRPADGMRAFEEWPCLTPRISTV